MSSTFKVLKECSWCGAPNQSKLLNSVIIILIRICDCGKTFLQKVHVLWDLSKNKEKLDVSSLS
jgi:hypothetical protein